MRSSFTLSPRHSTRTMITRFFHFPSRAYALVLLILCSLTTASTSLSQLEHFITARGDKLMNGNEEFRFVSFNIPNLHYIEDNQTFSQPNPWRIADEFEIRDALTSIQQIGGKVTRMYVPSVRKETDDSTIIRHVEGPGKFNEEAFRAYDKILQIANQTGVRVIIPLVDNWWWWGGPKEYAAFRGKEKEEFWTDSLLISDFKKTIEFIVNRVNTYTGVPFRQDKAILGWETGNELECPFTWTKEIAAYIKSLDTNHLVIEGTHSTEISDDALGDPNINVLSTHHYRSSLSQTLERITNAREKARGRKPYFIGEFGFIPTADMRTIIDTVISNGMSGILIWSLRTHNRDGGFYYHTEPGYNITSYRWPGFESGVAMDEVAVCQLFREKAYQIYGREPEPLPTPDPPQFLPIETPYKISWKGSAGAMSYLIQRKSDDDVLWQVIAPKANDSNIGYRPLFMDTTVEIGKKYLYQMRAKNTTGYSELSEPFGPVSVDYRMLVDEMEGESNIYAKSGGIRLLNFKDVAKAKEDNSRVAGETGDFIVYKLPGRIISVQVDIFMTTNDEKNAIGLLSGDNSDTLSTLPFTRQIFEPFRNVYGYYTPVTYLSRDLPADHRYVKIALSGNVQISRVEVKYGGIE